MIYMEEYFMMLEDTKDENTSNNAVSCHFGGCCLSLGNVLLQKHGYTRATDIMPLVHFAIKI